MSRVRLRPAWSPEKLAELYSALHDHHGFQDHRLRVAATISVAQWLASPSIPRAADLSCGDGAILSAIPAATRIFGDFAPGYEYTGPIEQTISAIPLVDLFVCCETLEHLDDPDAVLGLIRSKARFMLLSTPVEAWRDDNPEHYWAWSRADVEEMLDAAGFAVVVYAECDFTPSGLPYRFGIWGCR